MSIQEESVIGKNQSTLLTQNCLHVGLINKAKFFHILKHSQFVPKLKIKTKNKNKNKKYFYVKHCWCCYFNKPTINNNKINANNNINKKVLLFSCCISSNFNNCLFTVDLLFCLLIAYPDTSVHSLYCK